MGEQRQIQASPYRGLNRDQSAKYVGVGTTKFDEMVADGRMPKPKKIDGRVVWDVRRLDTAFDNLPDENQDNPWDRTCGLSSATGQAK